MSDALNPYQPPSLLDDDNSWWAKLKRFLFGVPLRGRSIFAEGDAIICDGIAFYLDRDDTTVCYAASPSAIQSDQRMQLIVGEAIRVLPLFIADHPHVLKSLLGRNLVVRMIESYCDNQQDYLREFRLDCDVLELLFGVDGESETPDEHEAIDDPTS